MADDKPPGTGRIETFVDGVVAIIITIMVLELKIPAEVFSQGRIDDVLAEFGPKLAVYALSFIVIAIMLVNHHMLMRAATRATNALYWWNANLLFWMSLIPLSTAALGEAPLQPLAVAFYGAVLAANSISFTMLHRTCACLGDRDGRLDDIHRVIIKKDAFFTAIYALSVPLAFVSIYASMAIFLIRQPISFPNSCPGPNPGADRGAHPPWKARLQRPRLKEGINRYASSGMTGTPI
jgi:uncharacterized membrane protein